VGRSLEFPVGHVGKQRHRMEDSVLLVAGHMGYIHLLRTEPWSRLGTEGLSSISGPQLNGRIGGRKYALWTSRLNMMMTQV
jgi:hypothetical protein